MTGTLELLAQFAVIVNLPVEGQDDIPIRADHRLIPCQQVEDAQANRAQGNVRGFVRANIVWSAMSQLIERIVNARP